LLVFRGLGLGCGWHTANRTFGVYGALVVGSEEGGCHLVAGRRDCVRVCAHLSFCHTSHMAHTCGSLRFFLNTQPERENDQKHHTVPTVYSKMSSYSRMTQVDQSQSQKNVYEKTRLLLQQAEAVEKATRRQTRQRSRRSNPSER
jgi:hypothetical protein